MSPRESRLSNLTVTLVITVSDSTPFIDHQISPDRTLQQTPQHCFFAFEIHVHNAVLHTIDFHDKEHKLTYECSPQGQQYY